MFADLSVFNSGTTQYLVVFPLEKPDLINKSAKIQRLAKFKTKPKIVAWDWLINSVESGEIQPADDYLI